ncbi:alpha/beta fold hydrolase [Butyrivibrio sp. VCB2006]|uniref:alpha/beta fold hydrolase n=1 Tax=Butyrivibrio sp. VCB2006 TaxID=1280679 RepID=UPI0003FE751E|nr:alpha/beta fold hydrolase [Butyrivibrio sp. VCB2006]
MNNTITLLGEDDFLSAMENENKKWRNECVTRGSLSSFDGTKLSYYVASPNKPIGSVTIVHGMAEFWGKYHEYAWYLYQAGYKVFFMENRGHGYSEGKVKDPQLIYVDDYSTYAEDLRCFVESVVVPESKGLEMMLIAHSMGGAIATLFLEKHPQYYKAAILSSPMLKMKAGNLSPLAVFALRLYAKLFRKTKSIAPNQKRFNPDTPFETSSAKSRPRFDYQLQIRRKDEHYQMTGATFGWALASIKVHRDIFRHINNIKIPVDIFTAGQDHLIDPIGYDMFKERLPETKIHAFSESRHEIFNADEVSRKRYYTEVLSVLQSHL